MNNKSTGRDRFFTTLGKINWRNLYFLTLLWFLLQLSYLVSDMH